MIISQVSYRTNGPLVLVMFQKSEISKNAVSERWCSDSRQTEARNIIILVELFVKHYNT